MFDLQKTIDQWEAKTVKMRNLERADVLEMRTHLEDSVQTLINSNGVGEEDAWAIALYRLGETSHLSNEYETVNTNYEQLYALNAAMKGILGFLIVKLIIQNLAIIPTYLGPFSYLIPLAVTLLLIIFIVLLGAVVNGRIRNWSRKLAGFKTLASLVLLLFIVKVFAFLIFPGIINDSFSESMEQIGVLWQIDAMIPFVFIIAFIPLRIYMNRARKKLSLI